MKQDFSKTPIIDLEIMVERSLASGTMPVSAINFLTDGGIPREDAEKIVTKVAKKVETQRADEIESVEAPRKRAKSFNILLIVMGLLLCVMGIKDPLAFIPGFTLIALGARRLFRMVLRGDL